jgi:hypothetical protein
MKKIITLIVLALILTTPLCDAENATSPPPVVPQPSTPAGPSENAAKIVLNAPSTAKIGELVRLDASASTASSFKWLTNPESKDFEVYADGRKAVFSARKAGLYQFTLAVSLKDTVDVITFTIKVEGPIAPPASDSLEEWIPYWMAEMELPAAEKEALAVSFEQIALKMTVLATPEAIIKATAEANRAALGANLPAWIPLLQKIQVSLDKLAKSGKMTTPQQHAEVWAAIARGIRKG